MSSQFETPIEEYEYIATLTYKPSKRLALVTQEIVDLAKKYQEEIAQLKAMIFHIYTTTCPFGDSYPGTNEAVHAVESYVEELKSTIGSLNNEIEAMRRLDLQAPIRKYQPGTGWSRE